MIVGLKPSRNPLGTISPNWLAVLGSTLLVLVLLALFLGRRSRAPEALFVYCAAGVKAPVEAAAREYERDSGVRIELTFGPSQTLLANIALTRRGDLYIPADDSYLDLARQKQLIAEVVPLAEMTAVLAIKKDSQKRIRSFKDITGLSLAQANPDVAAIGKLMREKLPPSEWQALNKQTRVFTTAVTEVANDVKLGAVDAGFIWDAMAAQYPELELIHLPELETTKGKVAAAVLKCSRRRAETLKLLTFLSSREKGLKHFERNGFKIVPAEK